MRYYHVSVLGLSWSEFALWANAFGIHWWFFCWFLDIAVIVVGFVSRHLCSVLKLLFMSSKKCADKKRYLFRFEIMEAFLHLNGLVRLIRLFPACVPSHGYGKRAGQFSLDHCCLSSLYRQRLECQCLLVPFLNASLPATFVPKQMNHDGNWEETAFCR